jgi:hypothetical protein
LFLKVFSFEVAIQGGVSPHALGHLGHQVWRGVSVGCDE